MRLTLLRKNIGLVFAAVALVGGGNYLTSRYFLSNTLDEQNSKEITIRADLVAAQFEEQKKSLTASGFLMATNAQVVGKMVEADTPWLQQYAKKVMVETGVESITISDASVRSLSGLTTKAFRYSVCHSQRMWNCPRSMRKWLDCGSGNGK